MVASYLKIPQINEFQAYIGSGFKDFTTIIEILNYDEKKLQILIKNNQQKILKIFDSIS